jgi:hypothetical protein
MRSIEPGIHRATKRADAWIPGLRYAHEERAARYFKCVAKNARLRGQAMSALALS